MIIWLLDAYFLPALFGIYDNLSSDHVPGLQKYDMCMTEHGPQGIKIVGRHIASTPKRPLFLFILPLEDTQPKSYEDALRVIKKLKMDNEALREENLKANKKVSWQEQMINQLFDKIPVSRKNPQKQRSTKTKKPFKELSKLIIIIIKIEVFIVDTMDPK